jgi:hypothetical protein
MDEPWWTRGWLHWRNSERERARSCVAGCEGIPNPGAIPEALQAAGDLAHAIHTNDREGVRKARDRWRAALRKLEQQGEGARCEGDTPSRSPFREHEVVELRVLVTVVSVHEKGQAYTVETPNALDGPLVLTVPHKLLHSR